MRPRTVEEALFENPTPRVITWIRVGTALSLLALAALAWAVVRQFDVSGQFAPRLWSFFAAGTTWTFLAAGLGGTLVSAAMAAVLSLGIGLVFLLGRLSTVAPVRWLATGVIEVLRGVPVLLLIYFCFLVLPPLGVKLPTYWMLTLPVALSTAAVVAEVYRAGVLAVPRGQAEAAASLGLGPFQTFRLVLFPQALKYVVPSLVAQLVIVVKETTFGYVVTYGELMQNAKVLISNYDSLIPVYLVVALVYALVNTAIAHWARKLRH